MELVFDIEGNGLGEVTIDKKPTPEISRIWCLIAKDINDGTVYTYREHEIAEGVELLRNADTIIGHNIVMYDIPVLERFYGPINTEFIDTLIVSRIKYPDIRSHPLGNNSLRAWGESLGLLKQDYTGGFDEFTEEMLKYCVQDVHISEAVYRAQEQFIEDNTMTVRLEHRISKIIARQIENGMGFDIDAAEKLEREILMEKAELDDSLCYTFPPVITERWSEKTGKKLKDNIEHFNPNSRQQIAARFKKKYGWEPPVTDKGNPKVDEAVLKKLSFPEAKLLCRGFELTKLHGMLTDWISRAIISRDGRIHGNINPQGAVTGRMTASQPNLQQVSGESRARALFVPREGWVQVGIDASGLEARLLANRMFEWDGGEYGELVINGDIHTHNQTQAGLSSREEAKTFFYALIYGAGNVKIGAIIGKGVGAGASLKKRFLDNMPALKKLIERCEFQAAKKGTITLLDGREVPCRSKHASLNVQIQGDGAMIMKVALAFLYMDLESKFKGRYALMATVHDEWQLECDPSIAEEVGQTGVEAIIKAGEFLKCVVPMDGEYRIGNNWSECH